MENAEKQLSIWNEEYLDRFNVLEKRDLTSRVSLSYKFKTLRKPLDFNRLAELNSNKYSDIKVPKTLLISLSQYHKKDEEDVDFVDLVQMYYSILSIFDGEVDSLKLEKWKKANNLSFFGRVQYELMEKYVKYRFGKE